jgi:hypothetical protein
MAGWIFVDKEKDGGEMRQQMRRSMRGGYRYDGYSPMMHEDKWEQGYRMGYKHGYEDSEDDSMEMRRARDSRGRYV